MMAVGFKVLTASRKLAVSGASTANGLLMRGQIRTSLRDKSLRVKEVAVGQSILTRETVVDQRIGKQIGDAAGSLAGAKKRNF